VGIMYPIPGPSNQTWHNPEGRCIPKGGGGGFIVQKNNKGGHLGDGGGKHARNNHGNLRYKGVQMPD